LTKKYSIKEVQDNVETKFDCEINYKTIKNFYYKVINKLFGQPNDDAKGLVNLLEILKKKGSTYFNQLLSNNGHLEALVFATLDMIELYKLYKDMLILDTTFGLNRFNMPLLTLAGVKNDGTTLILDFRCF